MTGQKFAQGFPGVQPDLLVHQLIAQIKLLCETLHITRFKICSSLVCAIDCSFLLRIGGVLACFPHGCIFFSSTVTQYFRNFVIDEHDRVAFNFHPGVQFEIDC